LPGLQVVPAVAAVQQVLLGELATFIVTFVHASAAAWLWPVPSWPDAVQSCVATHKAASRWFQQVGAMGSRMQFTVMKGIPRHNSTANAAIAPIGMQLDTCTSLPLVPVVTFLKMKS